MSAVPPIMLLVLVNAATLVAANYGPVLQGRTSFYGGAPDNMTPTEPSYGTSEGSCGCVPLFSLAVIYCTESELNLTCHQYIDTLSRT